MISSSPSVMKCACMKPCPAPGLSCCRTPATPLSSNTRNSLYRKQAIFSGTNPVIKPHLKYKVMKSKVWFITGASKGFGFEIAKAALDNGDQVVATVRKDAGQLASRLGSSDRLLIVTLDVTNEKEVKAGVRTAIDRFGRIDILVNN